MRLQAFSNTLSRTCKDAIILIRTGALLVFGSHAFAMEITGATVDLPGKTLTITGTEFDNGGTAPQIWINEYELDIDTYSSDTIHVTFSLVTFIELFIMKDQYPVMYPVKLLVTALKISEETIEDGNGEDVVVPKVEMSQYCLGVEQDGFAFECIDGSGYLAPVTRQVDWRIPNDPKGDTYVDYSYKFGPVLLGTDDNKRGDPVYYQILHDYKISLNQYLEEYDDNNFGDTLLDRCDDALDNLSISVEN